MATRLYSFCSFEDSTARGLMNAPRVRWRWRGGIRMKPMARSTKLPDDARAPPPPPGDQTVDAVRERIYESALRLGLMVRAYVSRPDQHLHVRQALGELLEEARSLSDEVQALSHGRPRPAVLNAGEEADRLVSMITALRTVLARLESLERKRSAAPVSDRDQQARAALKSEIDRLVAKLGEEEAQLHTLESELMAERRLRLRAGGKVDELRRMRRRLAVAEGRTRSMAAHRDRLKRRLGAADELIRKLRRRLRLARKGTGAKARRRSGVHPTKRKRRGRGRDARKKRGKG